jgi:HSP20 family protein
MGKVRYIFRPDVGHGTTRRQPAQTAIFRQWTVTAYQDQAWRPPTDVYETVDALVVKVEIAGMNDEDFRVTYSDRILSVTGTRHDFDAKLGYHQMEVAYGEFRTEVELHTAVDANEIQAIYQNGFLVVTLPKR